MANTKYPAFRWHPATGVCHCVENESGDDDSFLDFHPDDSSKAGDQGSSGSEDPKTGVDAMTKAEIMAALDAGNVEYDKNANKPALYSLLDTRLRETLAKTDQDVPDNATVPSMLAMLSAD